LRALRKRKPQETQALALALASNQSVEAVVTMIGCLPTQALAFRAVFVYATHATQAIAFKWKPGLTPLHVFPKYVPENINL